MPRRLPGLVAGAGRGRFACWPCGCLGLTLALGLVLVDGLPVRAGSFTAENARTLDRVALAVDGVESSYGADPNMWRPERDGPQGPMQVSAAAATDVGGGDRFDPAENQALGRAYLARLYRRYASWADAIAAYNWGPGNMDAWIDQGRPIDKFPVGVALYRVRVLFGQASGGGGLALAGQHLQPRRSLADRRHPSHDSLAVEQLYGAIMSDHGGQ